MYLRRWFLLLHNRWLNVYLHQFCRSDYDRALHDHPWWNCLILLSGGYHEVTPTGIRRRRRFRPYPRRAGDAHHVLLDRA